MTTRLEAPLKRELDISGEPWTLTITPEGFALAPKGRRKGLSMGWAAFVSGEAALATSLNASLREPMPQPAKRTLDERSATVHDASAGARTGARLRRVK